MELTAKEALSISANKFLVKPDPDKVGEWLIVAEGMVLDHGYEQRSHAEEMVRRILEWRQEMIDPYPGRITKQREIQDWRLKGVPELQLLQEETGIDFDELEIEHYLNGDRGVRIDFIYNARVRANARDKAVRKPGGAPSNANPKIN